MLLNYNYGFWRLTELYQRSLYIKYFQKDVGKNSNGKGDYPQKQIGFDGAEEGEFEPNS